jgi:DNA-binding CsgD family transcriptional regulator
MSNRVIVIRTCPRCSQQYLGGTYGQHRQKHPRRVTAVQARITDLMAQGYTQSEVARLVGVSRQRVNAVVRRAA